MRLTPVQRLAHSSAGRPGSRRLNLCKDQLTQELGDRVLASDGDADLDEEVDLKVSCSSYSDLNISSSKGGAIAKQDRQEDARVLCHKRVISDPKLLATSGGYLHKHMHTHTRTHSSERQLDLWTYWNVEEE